MNTSRSSGISYDPASLRYAVVHLLTIAMNLLMISGDRSMLAGKQGAFWYTLEAFSKEWSRIDVICPRGKMENGELRMQNFFGNVYFHPSPYPLWRQPRWIVEKGMDIVAHAQPAVMTVHDYPPFYNGIGAKRLSEATGVPYVLEVHHIVGSPVSVDFKERVGRWMSRLYFPRAIKKADSVRTVSKDTAQTLIKWGAPSAKIHVVPSFYLDAGLPSQVGDVSKQYDVAFCARLVANKGCDRLLKAMAKLPDAKLLIIGDGPERSHLEKLSASLGISNRVEFKGWLPTQLEVLRSIRSAKMLVMNSLSEGGPRVPLEAMTLGVPVIVTNVGVMPDVIVDGVNGLFTTGEPDDLAAKIQRLLQNTEERERIGREGTKILEQFERSKLIKQYAMFLRNIGLER